MNDDLQQPPVIDLDRLLQPISEENPSGESLRYSGLYDQIVEARRADENLNQGAWQTELKVADYHRVIELAEPALTTQTKDLQIAVWFSEALIKIHGFTGLRDSLKLITGLQANFWDTLHPEIDEGDMEGRANAISWFEINGGDASKSAKYTGGQGYGFTDWQDSQIFDIPENLESMSSEEQTKYTALRTQAEKEGRVTAEMWKKEISATRRLAVEKSNFIIEECWEAFTELNRVIEEKYDLKQAPGTSKFRKTLEDIHTQVKKILEEKRIEEPDPEPEEEVEGEVAQGGDGAAVGAKGGGSLSGAIQNRKDALKRLAEIADFFQKTEPHSPVSYLVQRAVKWGNMPLENWLQDVIKDESILSQLRQTLGFNTGGGPPGMPGSDPMMGQMPDM
jgi:type VI secretion system protein ImpA